MEICIAGHAGFCFGVKRAIQLAEDAAKHPGPVHTLGPLIHNRQVIAKLAREGVKQADTLEAIREGTVIFRSHGVAPEAESLARAKGLTVVDATCPFVKKAQEAARDLARAGYTVVVVGDRHHPEVEAIVAWAGGDAPVVETVEDAERLPRVAKIGAVAQTTLAPSVFAAIVGRLRTKADEVAVCHTICTATEQRQAAAVALAKDVDVMIVVGGKNSANTTRLAGLCAAAGARTYHIETAAELRPEWFRDVARAGITAGASTPDWIIEEVYKRMQEMDLTRAYDQSFVSLHEGEIIKGTVVQVKKDGVMVDVGYKSEGVVPAGELGARPGVDPAEVVRVGDEIEVMVVKVEGGEGNPILSRKRAAMERGWQIAEEAFTEQRILTVTVMEVVKGGLAVDVAGLRGFMPASQVERRFVPDLESYVGRELRAKIIEFNRHKRKIVLSRRVVVEAEEQLAREAAWNSLAEGQVRTGTVKRLTDYGAFVDLGGVEGLLHISEMSWQRIKHPSELVAPGDTVDVVVLKLDREAGKISLGLKQNQADPWTGVADKYKVGSVYQGKVVKLTKFGAFVALEPGVEGLVHISQLADKRVTKPEEVVRTGDVVAVKVLEVNPGERRLALSMREVEQDKEQAAYRQYIAEQKTEAATVGDKLGHLLKDEGRS